MRSELHIFPDLALVRDVVSGSAGVVVADPTPELCGIVRGVASQCTGENPGTDVDVQASVVDDPIPCDTHAGQFWQMRGINLSRAHIVGPVRVLTDAAYPAALS